MGIFLASSLSFRDLTGKGGLLVATLPSTSLCGLKITGHSHQQQGIDLHREGGKCLTFYFFFETTSRGLLTSTTHDWKMYV